MKKSTYECPTFGQVQVDRLWHDGCRNRRAWNGGCKVGTGVLGMEGVNTTIIYKASLNGEAG
jgi:hypothetical protein